MKRILGISLVLLAIYSCSQDTYPLLPIESPTAYTHTRTRWTIFDDVLNTVGGDVLYYPSDPGHSVMYLTNRIDGTAYSGKSYFRLFWSGGSVFWEANTTDNPTDQWQHAFAGISLIVAPFPEYYDTYPGLDMSDGKYTSISFYVRGSLSEGYKVKFEGPNGAKLDNVNLLSTWQRLVMPLGDLNNIKDFFKVTIEYPPGKSGVPPGSGGYVDFDYITYEL